LTGSGGGKKGGGSEKGERNQAFPIVLVGGILEREKRGKTGWYKGQEKGKATLGSGSVGKKREPTLKGKLGLRLGQGEKCQSEEPDAGEGKWLIRRNRVRQLGQLSTAFDGRERE